MSDRGDLVIDAIRSRRSATKVRPDPVPRELVEEAIGAAVRAPNHHLTGPWRFVVLAGGARREVGEAHLRAVTRLRGDLPPEGVAKETGRLERAPVVIACCVVTGEDPVQAREDRDAVAAAIENLLIAAQARGLGAMWRTGTMVDEPEVHEALGLGPCDAVVGFVYLGWPEAPPAPPPDTDEEVRRSTVWRGW
jgi:nitroreductase